MKTPAPAPVEWVRPGSPAAKGGIERGDRVVRVNGRRPRDYIDYRYLIAEARLSVVVQDGRGRKRTVEIEKPMDEDLGLRFGRDVFDGIRTCRNRCPFCFVAQLPEGLRPALYIRDDDYRLSFLHGNFVTLTNLTAADRRRIVRLHLSPLYVSVHATEPEVRARVFGGRAGDVAAEMRPLISKGIEFHTQIVVCPGLNDGVHLARTVADLAALWPGVRSIGVVPVGLTKHRGGLPQVRRVTPRMAGELVGRVEGWQRAFRKALGSRFVFAADELYLYSGRPLPGRAHYEGFWQLGNGIGCGRLFLEEVKGLRPLKLRRQVSATLVTGEMAADLVKQLAGKLGQGGSVRARVCIVRNRLLGRSVTTAGLLPGRDIARALRALPTSEVVIVPASAVREGEGFLDGMTTEELAGLVGAQVVAAGGPREAAAALRQYDRRRAER